MWGTGRAPYKAARTENEDDRSSLNTAKQTSSSTSRLLASSSSIASFSGAFISAVLSATPETASSQIVQLSVWKHRNPGSVQFNTWIVLPKTFLTSSNNNSNSSCFLGEGVDGTSVVICDSLGNAGTITLNNNNNNNNNNQQQQQVFLHTSPLDVGILREANSIITAFSCINGLLFFGTSNGGVAHIRVVNREGANKWVVVTASSTAAYSFAENQINSNSDNNKNNNNNSNSANQNNGWVSRWFGGMFGGSSATDENESQQQQQQQKVSSPVLSKRTSTAIVTKIFPSRLNQVTNQNHAAACYALHGTNRVVFYGPSQWEWTCASGTILAVGDCHENGAVYILHCDGTDASRLFITLLSLAHPNHGSAETTAVAPLRSLNLAEDRFYIFPLRYEGERRALVITSQFAVSYTVAVGPRAPTNEITVLEQHRYIVDAQVALNANNSLTLLLGGHVSRSIPVTEIFSSALDQERDDELRQFVERSGPDQGFLQMSNSITINNLANPWSWSSNNNNNQNNNVNNNKNQQNLLTFISSSLTKRLSEHEQFLARYHGKDQWADTSAATRASIMENHVGLSMLKKIRDIQNTCQVHLAVAKAFDGLSNSELDRARFVNEVFGLLIPRTANHGKCIRSNNGNNMSEAEIVFNHPMNAFVFLYEASQLLREVTSDVAVSVQDKLMWSAVVGSLWFFCSNVALDVVKRTAADDFASAALNSPSNSKLTSILSDQEWLDSGLPLAAECVSDSIAFSLDSTPTNPERKLVHTALVDVLGELVSLTVELHSNGKSIAPRVIHSFLLREPFIKSASFGYPYGLPEISQHQDLLEIGRSVLALSEAISVRHAVFPILWDLCSSVYLANDDNNNNNQQQNFAAKREARQRFRNHCESLRGFFEFAASALLSQNREIELLNLHTIAPRTTTAPLDRARDEFLASNAPSVRWGASAGAIDSILASGYESAPNAPLAQTNAQHRSICASLAKLAWVAEGRPLRNRKVIEMEGKVASAQLRFLCNNNSNNNNENNTTSNNNDSNSSNFPALNQTQTIRALLSLQKEPGDNYSVAAELADGLPREDPARAAILMEVVQKCFAYEGGRLIAVMQNHSIGDVQRVRSFEESLTAKTLKKSNDLLILCGREGDRAIANVTSNDFAAMLLDWRRLQN